MEGVPLLEVAGGGREERCLCNKLLCVVKGDVVEIKCNKCKRLFRIHTRGIVRTEMAEK